MFHMAKVGLFFISILVFSACSVFDHQEPSREFYPAPPDTLQEDTLYTNMTTYGRYMGCNAGVKNLGGPQDGWVKAPSLPGTYEEYLNGWESGFRKCRTDTGSEETPGGPIVPPGDLYP